MIESLLLYLFERLKYSFDFIKKNNKSDVKFDGKTQCILLKNIKWRKIIRQETENCISHLNKDFLKLKNLEKIN